MLISVGDAMLRVQKSAIWMYACRLPAPVAICFLGHGLVTRSELDKAVAAYGSDNNGLYPIEGLRPDVFNADVLSLQSISPQNFRFDLMGQAHEVLPLQDTTNARTAGKSEEGTYCAVPIVWDSWTVNDPVPFWYVCENNWQFFVNCKDAFEETYNDKDHYGYQNLRACLRTPMEVCPTFVHKLQHDTKSFNQQRPDRSECDATDIISKVSLFFRGI